MEFTDNLTVEEYHKKKVEEFNKTKEDPPTPILKRTIFCVNKSDVKLDAELDKIVELLKK